MFDRLRSRLADWLTYHETVDQLSWLDDRILTDAGIKRTHIRRIARGTRTTGRGR